MRCFVDMSKFMLRIYNNIAYKEIAWCYSTKIRAGNFMCTVIEINIELADSSNTGAGTSQTDLSSAPAHGNKKPARQKIFLKFVIIFHDFHSWNLYIDFV